MSEEARRRLRQATRAVAQQVTQAGSPGVFPFKVGVVTGTSPLTVDYGDGVDLQGFAHLAGYTPTVDDVVLVLASSPVATIFDKFA